jgi:L-lactate dehydrogenase complex protein LldE
MNMTGASPGPKSQPRVGLFVTCLVDIIRPSVGFAAVKLLEDAGCKVVVPSQTCCGQPAYNAGDRDSAKKLARQAIDTFEDCDYVVAPSGSCGGMLIKHYPELFAGEPDLARRAERFAEKTHELISFLVDVMGVKKVAARYDGTVAYHDSCAGLRELGVKTQPRRLLAGVEGLKLVELTDAEVCCGFGGLFATKYGERDRRPQGRRHPQRRTRYGARWRSRVSFEHGGQTSARRIAHQGAARRRDSGGHG